MPNGIPFSLTFRDAKGQTGSMRGFIKPQVDNNAVASAIEAIRAAAGALSVAVVSANNYANATAPTNGVAGVYGSVEDKAVMVYQTASGALHRYSIAAPIASMFQPDDETVDFSVAAVGTFNAAVIAGMCDRDGVAISSTVGGYRVRRRTQRKFNVRTRNTQLTGQGL